MMKKYFKFFLKVIVFLGFPFTFLSSLWLMCVRKVGIGPLEDFFFMKIGVLPVIDHYYQPLINPKKHLIKSLRDDRDLPGIDFNTAGQLELLSQFNYSAELAKFPFEASKQFGYYYNNEWYEAGDADYLYNMIRHFKPKRIVEIGSGFSTLMAVNALSANKNDDNAYKCKHICIEPYERSWLEEKDVEVIRKRVETIDVAFFRQLEANDILFIDSSHMIRPQGDVLFEYLEILPQLNPGVIIHIHDIFLPKDYLNEWVYEHFLWNEQYLLEAFLTFNNKFKIIGALNYLSHHYRDEFAGKCPAFAKQPDCEPRAFWMVKTA